MRRFATSVLHADVGEVERFFLPQTPESIADETQRRAVLAAVQSGLLVITGGPGTGKTTTINAIIRCFEAEGAEILLAAPTGRAAARMTEATGREAKTIHRLLEVTGAPTGDGEGDSGRESWSTVRFDRNKEQPLEADCIIIDEMSMVDLRLFHALLLAVPVGAHLILVGDSNQLPSVGAGNVLRDLIASACLPVARLTQIYRQAAESDIVVNAHKMMDEEPIDLGKRSKDFLFIRQGSAEGVIQTMLRLITEKLPAYVGADAKSIQLLTPVHPLEPTPRACSLEAADPITIGDNVWLGGGVIVCPGVTIGDNCVIGAGSVVTKDVPASSLAVGNPARVLRQLDDSTFGPRHQHPPQETPQ